MKNRKLWRVMLLASFCGTLPVATSYAETNTDYGQFGAPNFHGESDAVDYYDKVDYYEIPDAEILADDGQSALPAPVVTSTGAGCCDTCAGSCSKCCRNGGFFFGAELPWLQPYNGNGVGVSSVFALVGTANVGRINPDFDLAPRISLGYDGCGGFGFRLRYWQFDQHYTAPASGVTVFGASNGTAFHGWDTWVLDAEVTDSAKLGCNWDMTYSAGFRYLQYTETAGLIGATPATSFVVAKNIDGIGLTTGLELRRRVSCALAGFVNVRGSAILGDEDNSFGGGVFTFDNQTNDIKYINEAQAGVEYNSSGCSGSYFVRGGVEVQYWDGFGVDNQPLTRGNVLLPSKNSSSGFAGLFFTLGYNW